MNPQPIALDPVAVAIAIAAALFGPDLAEVVGPYAVIVLGAMLGATWSASRRPATDRGNTAIYMTFWVVASLLFTVPCAVLASNYLPASMGPRVLLPFVATVISGVGSDWLGVFKWAINLGRVVAERRAGATPPADPPAGGQQ